MPAVTILVVPIRSARCVLERAPNISPKAIGVIAAPASRLE